RRLQKAQPVHEVHVKGWRQRIAMPRRPFDLAANLSQFGVVKGGNHRALGVALEILIDNRVEQPLASTDYARTSCNRRSSPGPNGPRRPACARWCAGQT